MSYGPRRAGNSYHSGYSNRNNRPSYSSSDDSLNGVNGLNHKKRKASSGAAYDPAFKEPTKPPPSSSQRQGLKPSPQSPHQKGGVRPNPFYSRPREQKTEFVNELRGPHWEWPSFFQRSENWQDHHKLAYYRTRCMALEFENKMLFDQINQLIGENSVFAMERGQAPRMQLTYIPAFDGQQTNTPKSKESPQSTNTQSPEKKQGKNKKQQPKPNESKPNNSAQSPHSQPPQKKQGKNKDQCKEATHDADSSNESLVFEVDEEMMNFLEKTMLHKLSLKKLRKAEEQKNSEDMDVDTAAEKKEGAKNSGPREPMGLRCKEDFDKLYGKDSELIQGLETSLKLKFNRLCDLHKPEYWPSVPLNPGNDGKVVG